MRSRKSCQEKILSNFACRGTNSLSRKTCSSAQGLTNKMHGYYKLRALNFLLVDNYSSYKLHALHKDSNSPPTYRKVWDLQLDITIHFIGYITRIYCRVNQMHVIVLKQTYLTLRVNSFLPINEKVAAHAQFVYNQVFIAYISMSQVNFRVQSKLCVSLSLFRRELRVERLVTE